MTELTQESLLALMLVFCRVGGCFLLIPGIASERVPAQVRFFLAFAISAAIGPLVMDDLREAAVTDAARFLPFVISETATGLLLGLLVRLFFFALEFAAIGAANYAGYGSAFTHAIESAESASPFSTLITLPATALFFILDLHIKLIELLRQSYATLPPGRSYDLAPSLSKVVATLASSFLTTLQVSAPLIVFSITINLMLGLLNKMIPQIPAYYISTPFLLLGGLCILYFLTGTVLLSFESNVAIFLAEMISRD